MSSFNDLTSGEPIGEQFFQKRVNKTLSRYWRLGSIPSFSAEQITPSTKSGDFYFQTVESGLPEREQMKIKRPYRRSE